MGNFGKNDHFNINKSKLERLLKHAKTHLKGKIEKLI
jgi:hypothetical protein